MDKFHFDGAWASAHMHHNPRRVVDHNTVVREPTNLENIGVQVFGTVDSFIALPDPISKTARCFEEPTSRP